MTLYYGPRVAILPQWGSAHLGPDGKQHILIKDREVSNYVRAWVKELVDCKFTVTIEDEFVFVDFPSKGLARKNNSVEYLACADIVYHHFKKKKKFKVMFHKSEESYY